MSGPLFKPLKSLFIKDKKKFLAQQAAVSSFIHLIGDSPQLRKPSQEVRLKDLNSVIFREKLGYLQRCFWRYRKATGMGRGIAAVQVGIPDRFFVVLFKKPDKLVTYINPKITKRGEELLQYPEICMSAAPLVAPVARPAWIEFEYVDENGKAGKWDMKADTKERMLYNRIVQHEIDHLEGIINIDKVNARELTYAFDKKQFKKAVFKKVGG